MTLRRSRTLAGPILPILLAVALVVNAMPAGAQQPKTGGELVFAVPSEPPSYDGHREETFGVIHPIAPHYSTLLKVDPTDPSGTKPVGDLAESWTVAPGGLAYTFKLRRGVKFHDGSELTSRDVKASYDKIIFPPAGISSSRKGQYRAVEVVEAPDPTTVRFRLKWAESSFLLGLASPWNFIYKADILAKDLHWYEKNIMGTGPFTFVEHVKGSHWVGRKNLDYWDQGKPYLDGYRALFMPAQSANVAAIRGERAHIQFRSFSPAERDSVVKALGSKIVVQESPWDCILMVAINHEKKPFDDRRIRRALTLALDRYQGSQALSKIAIVKEVAGVQVPGTPYATPPADLEKLAGYGRDINAARAEARRLLKEAGAENLQFIFTNRGTSMPYEPLAIWLIDQWQQIGVHVQQVVVEPAAYYTPLRAGDFQVAMDFQCGFIVEPDLDLYKFISTDKNPANYGRYTDRTLDELFEKQARASNPEERKALIRQFEKRLLDEEAHYLLTLQWRRIVPHSAKVKGWQITPSHYLNNQLDTVWLTE
ncbi:MAG TPA: ABC transporter substrate-binding protein [Vicinamibacteria bacterium]|nr:ABC transporter substrate-binding protein [Vicinamibacteria bacterium]